MSFFVEDSKEFENAPPGMHLARCYRIIDMGTQKSEYMGEVKILRKVKLQWELFAQDDNGVPLRMKDNRPFSTYKDYTLSWAEKATLRIHLQSWRGKPFSQEEMRRFDLKTILGAWCMLNMMEQAGKEGKTYVNVVGVSSVPAMIKQAGMPQPVNKNGVFMLENPDMEMYATFSENLKRKIASSPEWAEKQRPPAQRQHQAPAPAPVNDDDIPF